jgi:hypothetical protein
MQVMLCVTNASREARHIHNVSGNSLVGATPKSFTSGICFQVQRYHFVIAGLDCCSRALVVFSCGGTGARRSTGARTIESDDPSSCPSSGYSGGSGNGASSHYSNGSGSESTSCDSSSGSTRYSRSRSCIVSSSGSSSSFLGGFLSGSSCGFSRDCRSQCSSGSGYWLR